MAKPPGQKYNFPLPPGKEGRHRNLRPDHPSQRRRLIDFVTIPDIPHPVGHRPTVASHSPDWEQALSLAVSYRFPKPKDDMDINLDMWGTIPNDEPSLDALATIHPPYTEDAPWQKMDSEPPHTYEAFLLYRDMGMSTRTYKAVAELVDVTPMSITRWAADYNWNMRIVAWDEYRERIYTAAVIERTREMAEKHAEVAAKGIAALSTAFEAIIHRMEDDPEGFMGELSEKSASQLLSLAKSSAQVLPNLMSAERLSRGLPTELSASIAVVDQRITIHSRDDLAAIAFGLADVFAGSQGADVVDVRGTDPDARAEADPEDE